MIQNWKFRKFRLRGLLTAVLLLAMVQVASADILLMDIFGGTDAVSTSEWTNAGVTEDLTDAAAFVYNGGTFNLSFVTMSQTGSSGSFTGGTYAGNNFLNSYEFGFGPVAVSVGGFVDGSGAANDLEVFTSYLGLDNNTFTLEAEQDYKLYLFGSGDNDNQNTDFTFGGVTKTTSPTIVGSAADAGHFVTFDFTTGADLTGFTLDFTWAPDATTGSNGAFNGFALASVSAVPEPSSFALVAVGGLAVLGRRRRRASK